MKNRFASAVIATAAIASAFGFGAAHASTCTVSGTALASPSVTPGSVDDGKVVDYKIVVPSGKLGNLNMQMFNGDVDLTVCNTATGAVTCYSHNMVDVSDGCHIGVGIPDEIANDGSNVQEWPAALPPGTYRARINACWSSKDAGNCDYSDGGTGLGTPPPGTLDPLPPVQFVLGFVAD